MADDVVVWRERATVIGEESLGRAVAGDFTAGGNGVDAPIGNDISNGLVAVEWMLFFFIVIVSGWTSGLVLLLVMLGKRSGTRWRR